ncbi:hypothetical protein F5882DRAFT_290719, partial [Hyaloscypha sp. PMI_1271]
LEKFLRLIKERKPCLYKSRYNYVIRRPRGLSRRFLIANKAKEIEKTKEDSIEGNRP